MYTTAVFLSAFMILITVLTVRTLRCRARVYPPVTPPAMDIDPAGAAKKLSGAIKIETIARDDAALTDTRAFRDFARYLQRSFPYLHRVMEREVVNELSLLYRWPGSDRTRKPALFCAHIDVVPVDGETRDSWTHPPFSGLIAGGCVWGRGTRDIKNQLVTLMEAAEIMIRRGFVPERDIYFAFGHDEETRRNDGADRIAALLKDRGIQMEYVLDEGGSVTDNAVGGINRPVAFIGIAEKGFVNVHLSAVSEGGHSSMPPSRSAAGSVARAVARLESRQRPLTLTPPVREMIGALAPAMNFGNRLILSNLWLFAPVFKRIFARTPSGAAFLRTTVAPTMLRGSDAPNVLPQNALAVVNARILPGETSGVLMDHIRKTVNDDLVSVEMHQVYEPSDVSPADSYAFCRIAGAVKALWPDAVITPYMVAGGTDARKYQDLTGCVYRFTPVRMDNSEMKQVHGTDEHIPVSSLADSIRFYMAMFGV